MCGCFSTASRVGSIDVAEQFFNFSIIFVSLFMMILLLLLGHVNCLCLSFAKDKS